MTAEAEAVAEKANQFIAIARDPKILKLQHAGILPARVDPVLAAPWPRWIKPLSAYERRESSFVDGGRYG